MNYYCGVKVDIVITLAIKESVFSSPSSASGPLPVAGDRPLHCHHRPGPGGGGAHTKHCRGLLLNLISCQDM